MGTRAKWTLGALVFIVVMTASLYFLPASEYGPNAGVRGHLGPAFGSALIATLGAGAMIRWVLPVGKRNRDDQR